MTTPATYKPILDLLPWEATNTSDSRNHDWEIDDRGGSICTIDSHHDHAAVGSFIVAGTEALLALRNLLEILDAVTEGGKSHCGTPRYFHGVLTDQSTADVASARVIVERIWGPYDTAKELS